MKKDNLQKKEHNHHHHHKHGGFNTFGPYYEYFSMSQSLSMYILSLPHLHNSFLEIGAGKGKNSFTFATTFLPKNGIYIISDNSIDSIEKTNTHFLENGFNLSKKNHFENLEKKDNKEQEEKMDINLLLQKREKKEKYVFLKKLDVCEINVKSNSFDIIYIGFVLHHVHNLENALKECYRVLKKKGKLFIAEFNNGKKWPLMFLTALTAKKLNLINDIDYTKGSFGFCKNELIDKMKKIGFSKFEKIEIEPVLKYESGEKAFEHYGQRDYTKQILEIPENLKDIFKKTWIEIYNEYAEDNKLVQNSVIVIAHKD